jgi:hypothetical protein
VYVPAFCDSCAAVFRSDIVVEDSTDETFAGTTAGPCPVCGGMGHIPDGVFTFVGNTIEILSAPQRTKDELTSLANILTESCGNRLSPDEITEKINAEVPGLPGLANLLPQTRAELYSFVVLIVAVISLLLQENRDGDGATKVSVEQTINHILNETNTQADSLGLLSKPIAGRNEPCPCGSGKRYKRCCGQLT